MNIHQALSDIAEIRAQLDRTEAYRGFRSTAIGVSVLVVFAGAWFQSVSVDDPNLQIDRYLTIWFVVAVSSICIAAIEMLVRSRISKNRLVNRMHWSLVTQMAPSLLVGFVITLIIADDTYKNHIGDKGLLWALPGIWSMLYALGLFSCQRQLPTQSRYVATYILLVGILILAWNWKTEVPEGWQMMASFGVGHFLLAAILYWNVERRNGKET
jgi:hypothetical protein